MISFILIATIITAIALIFLVRPLLKTRSTFSYERQAQNIHFAKERLQELEQQLKNASISATDYEALKLEIETTLAEDIDLAEEVKKSPQNATDGRNGLLIALLCCLLPLGGLALYMITGTPAAISTLPTAAAPQAGSPAQIADIESMLGSLEAKLQENPNDIQGWTMLARSYQTLGRFQDAFEANLKVLQLGGENPNVYAALADSSALLAGGVMAGKPSEYAQRALALQENHPQALWLAGLSAAQSGNGDGARQLWKKLLPLLEGAPQQQQELQAIIDQTVNFSNRVPTLDPAEAADSAAGDAKSLSTANSAGPSINLRVAVDDALKSDIQDSDIVFVFARAKQGPPAPLAVKKLSAADLPTTITLTDSDAMMDQFKLSRFGNIVVSARVAKSGQPIAQAGDFQSALYETQTNSTELIDLIISQKIE